jgi:hypothetical protein
MSRMLLALLILVPAMAQAQNQKLSDAQIADMIEKQRRTVALNADGCAKYPEEDIIIVCGRDEEKERQKTGDQSIDNDRIRRGEGIATTKAARCLPQDTGCRIGLPPSYSTGFGSVPPPAIPLEEILSGLPEPDMIVKSGQYPAPEKP